MCAYARIAVDRLDVWSYNIDYTDTERSGNMIELFIAFIVGMLAMDFLWAWRLGIPQAMWYKFKHRNDPKPNYSEWSED